MKKISKKTIYKLMIAFSAILFIAPNAGLLREKRNVIHIAEMENRTINQLPDAPWFSGEFFRQFEGWYDDRILGRSDLIRNWAMWNGRIFDVLISKSVVRGKDGYLFSPSNMNHTLTDGTKKLDNIAKINEQCKRRNIRFVFMLTPNSEMVLSDLFTEQYPIINLPEVESSVAKKLDERGIEHCFVGADFVKLPLEERKNMYFEGDYHWTQAGGYLAAKKLLQQLELNDKINYPVENKKFLAKDGGYYREAGLDIIESYHHYPWNNNFVKEVYVTNSDDRDLNNGAMTNNFGNYGQCGEDIIINKEASNKIKVLILGDSFTSAMKPYLIQDVETIIYSHSRDIRKPKKSIDVENMLDRYKPDIVVFTKMEAFFFWESFDAMLGNMHIE